MTPDEAIEKVVRIVDHQTTPEQPDTVPKHTITMLATRDELTLPEANTALNDAMEKGLLVEEDERFRLA